MNINRNGESGSTPFRSGRFFTIDTNWYFSTREAMDQGPYRSREDAEYALRKYIENCQRVEKNWKTTPLSH